MNAGCIHECIDELIRWSVIIVKSVATKIDYHLCLWRGIHTIYNFVFILHYNVKMSTFGKSATPLGVHLSNPLALHPPV